MAHVVAEESGDCRFRRRQAARHPRLGIAVLIWFLGFHVIGRTAILMGQAEGMEGAMRGAWAMASPSFLTLTHLSMSEPPRDAN